MLGNYSDPYHSAITRGPTPNIHPVSVLLGDPFEGKEMLPVTGEGHSEPRARFQMPSALLFLTRAFPFVPAIACNLLQV